MTSNALSALGTLAQIIIATYLVLAGLRLFRRRDKAGRIVAARSDVLTSMALAWGWLVIAFVLVMLVLLTITSVAPALVSWAVGIACAWELIALYGIGGMATGGFREWIVTSERKYPWLGALTGHTDEELERKARGNDPSD